MNSVNCRICHKAFYSSSTVARHIRNIHPEHAAAMRQPVNKQIYCGLCSTEENKVAFRTYDLLIKHFTSPIHGITIEKLEISFANENDFAEWMRLSKLTTMYYVQRTLRRDQYLIKAKFYCCNRTSKGQDNQSHCTKKDIKAGGSKKIEGTCPSRIVARFFEDVVKVNFTVTHVGHELELRTRSLSEEEQRAIADKVRAGIPNKKIIEEAREVKNGKLERINLLDFADIGNIKRKFNIKIGKRQDPDYKPDCRILGPLKVSKTHREADKRNIMEAVEAVDVGKFMVKSSTVDDMFYTVAYGNMGICNCLGVFCRVCEMCVHRYKCECVEYTKKNSMCKHVHMVALHERRTRVEALAKRKESAEERLLLDSAFAKRPEGQFHENGGSGNEDLKSEDTEECEEAPELHLETRMLSEQITLCPENEDLTKGNFRNQVLKNEAEMENHLQKEDLEEYEEAPHLDLELHRNILLEQIIERSRTLGAEDFIEAAEKFLEETKEKVQINDVNGCKKRKMAVFDHDHTYHNIR